MSRQSGWIVLSRELLADVLTLLQAEVGEAKRELSITGKQVGWIVACVFGVLFFLFWVPAVIAWLLIQVLSIWLPAWGAGLVVLGLYLLVAVIFGFLAKAAVARLKNPVDVVLRRGQAHLDWWRSEVKLHPSEPAGSGAGTDGG